MNIITKFFEPILINKLVLFKFILRELVNWSYAIFNIYFLKEVVKLLQTWNNALLKTYLFYYVIITVFYLTVAFFMRKWWRAESFFLVIKNIHKKYMLDFNTLDNTYVENIWTGKSLSIISKWISKWSEFIMYSIEIPIRLFIWILAAFYFLNSLGYLYVILFLVLFIIVHIWVYFLNKKALKWRTGRIEAMIDYDKQLVKMIMSKFEILQNNKINREVWVLSDISELAWYYNKNLWTYLFLMFSLPDLIFFIIIVLILSVVLNTWIDVPNLVWFFLIITMLRSTMDASIDYFKNFTKEFYNITKFWDYFENAKVIEKLDIWEDFKYKNWDIELKNLEFSYGENIVFNDLNLKISWNKKIALVWASWSWKTTLVKLISGFLSQNSWEIIIDWQNISTLKLNTYYKNIWYLTQDPSVFDGSIYENLTYWLELNSSADIDNLIKNAIKDAWCDFIYDFKDWLETQIWERWVRLSGWQKQRLAIAKLFLKNPKIIILDEPTSALDSFSEELITKSFEKLFVNKTVLVIAHRLQTVKSSDEIIVFEAGKVIERWNHFKLIENNWFYKKMLDLQSGF